MILASHNLTKSFITDIIFQGVNFQINENEKVAVVGINGAGKSTLFKVITGELSPDSGEIIKSGSPSIGYLSQNSELNSESTIYDEILHANAKILEMEDTLNCLTKEMSENAHNVEVFHQISEQYNKINHEYELLDGYSYKSRVKGVLKGLGFQESEFDKIASILSGGQKTRLALAKILISEPDVLLLDEPTNHLDINAIEWLESYLSAYKGTLLIISHDRYFLDKIVSKVIELENGKCKTYIGDYSFYAKHKAIDLEIENKHYENQQKEIKRQEEIIRQLKSFNREKSVKRARSREKTLNKIELVDRPVKLNDTMHFALKPRIESGNDVLIVKDLKKAFTDTPLLENINFEIFKGEKVALIGDNGTGKSTIFKIITEHINKTEGKIVYGSNVHVGYYDQEHSLLNPNNNLIDEISDTYPDMNVGDIRNVLAAFLFTGDDVFKLTSSLSGGEKGRLTLAKLMLSKSNFLLLDEPTNHLDIISRNVLEETLKDYTGTLFFISHDRYFINKVATRILYLKPEGLINYPGNYDYYVEKRDNNCNNTIITSAKQVVKSNKEQWLQRKEEETRKRKKEKLTEKTEEEIHNIEKEIQEIDLMLCQENVYTNHEKVQELTNEKTELEESLIKLYDKWDELI